MLAASRRSKRIVFFLFVAAAVVGVMMLLRSRRYESVATPPAVDLASHPIYSKYDFGNDDSVINVGIQPLYSPIGIISETMRRDQTLRRALSRLGFEIRFHPFLKGYDVNYFLRRGDLIGGMSGDMPLLTAASSFDVIIPALIQQGFCSIVAERHMTVRELRRKRIGCAFGSSAHYVLLNALAFERLTESDVSMVFMEASELPEALSSGRISAFSAWEPSPTLALMKVQDAVVIHRGLSSAYLYFLNNYYAKYPEVVRQIVASEIRAIRWLKSDRQNMMVAGRWNIEAGNNLTGRSTALSVEQNVELASDEISLFAPLPFIPQAYVAPGGQIFREFEFLKRRGKFSETADWDKVWSSFDHAVIEKIISEPDRYKLDTFEYPTDGEAIDGHG